MISKEHILVGIVTLAVTVLGGVALFILQDTLSARSSLTWFEVQQFQLPNEFLSEDLQPGIQDLSDGVERDDDDFERIWRRNLSANIFRVLVVQNFGKAPAKDVVLSVPGFPVGSLQEARQRVFVENSNDGTMRVTFSSIEPGEQVQIVLVGGRNSVLVQHDGITIPEKAGEYLHKERAMRVATWYDVLKWLWVGSCVILVALLVWILIPQSQNPSSGTDRTTKSSEAEK